MSKVTLRAYKDGDIDAIPVRVGDFPRGIMGPLLMLSDGAGTLLDEDGKILMCMGTAHIWPGVVDVWSYVHPNSGTSALTLIRETRKWLNDYCTLYGVRRCNALAFNEEQRKWMALLGFVREGIKEAYGPDGQDVIEMVRWGKRGKRNERLQAKENRSGSSRARRAAGS